MISELAKNIKIKMANNFIMDEQVQIYKINKTGCINQIFRPKKPTYNSINGHGNCSICLYDPENNPRCIGFQELSLSITVIKMRESQYENK